MLQALNAPAIHTARSPQQRVAAIVFVAGLHIAVIAAIVIALNTSFKFPTVTTTILRFIPQTVPQQPASQPQGKVKLITPVAQPIPIPPPPWPVKDDPGKTITSDQGVGQGTSPPSVFVAAQAVIGTHTTPDYPPLETRLGHEGNVYLHLAIDANGVVADVRIVRSSGYDDLDQAAADWVKAHWRYLPATQGGVPTASSTDAIVTFRLTTR